MKNIKLIAIMLAPRPRRCTSANLACDFPKTEISLIAAKFNEKKPQST